MSRLNNFMIAEGINDKGIFKAVFMAGHPGAGKTFVLNNVKSGSIDPRWVNTDKVYPIFKEWWNDAWPKISDRVKTVNQNQLANYINSMLPLAIDGTANKVSTLMRRKSIIESFGYDTMMIFVNTSLETALERAQEREKKTGREVPMDFIKVVYDEVNKHKQYYRSKFDDWIEVDNDKGELTPEVINNVFKKASSFYESPLENPIGIEKKETMIENGWKYLDPNVVPMRQIQNRISGWYKK